MAYYKIDTPSGSISYEISGAGNPLLMLAGGPGLRAGYMRDLQEELSKTQLVILLHQRGTDPALPVEYSPATINLEVYLNDIETLREHLKIARWNILGHSWGGMLASAYCAEHLQAVERLILINSAGLHYSVFGYLTENLIQRLSGSEYARAIELAGKLQTPEGVGYATEFFKTMTPAYFFDKQKAFEFNSQIDEQFISFPVYALMAQDVVTRGLDLREKAKNFPGLVLSINSRQDMVGFQAYYDISTCYTHVEVNVIEQAGHYCWIEQPAICFNTITSFLNR